jgi:glycogen synthase
MRVLLYTYAYSPNVGGIETVVYSLARGLALYHANQGTRSIELTVATDTPAGGMDDTLLPFPVVRRPKFWQLVKLLRRAQVVHLAGPSFLPLILGLTLRKPIVIEHHSFQVICPNGLMFYEPSKTPCPGHFMAGRHLECFRCNAELGILTSIRKWVLTFPRRWLCQRVAMNIAPTNWLSSLLQLRKMMTIHHGLAEVSMQRFVRTKSPVATFAFIGRLVTCKGIRILLEASRILKQRGFQLRIRIVGDGPDRAELERLVRHLRLQDTITFLGQVSSDSLELHLSESCAVVMPSLAGEVFGLVAAESMQRGLPVIASDIGALCEVLGPAGLTFRAGDATSLANCMQRLIECPGFAEELGQEARKRVFENFRQSAMVESHVEVYNEVVTG